MKFSFSPSSTDLEKVEEGTQLLLGDIKSEKELEIQVEFQEKCSAYHRTKRRSPAYYLSGTGTLLSGTELGGTSSGGYLEHEK